MFGNVLTNGSTSRGRVNLKISKIVLLCMKERLVNQAISHGVKDEAVLAAIKRVPRDLFVPKELVEYAFEDSPLPIGEGQTISQPAMVALMAEASFIDPDDSVLEIGAGSGYGAAVLRSLASKVTTIERIKVLAERAEAALTQCGFGDVDVVVGDGTLGWAAGAPYNVIIVTATGPDAPEPLIEQLADGGRLVMPVETKHSQQHLMRFTRRSSYRKKHKVWGVRKEKLMPVRFVPLIGEHGF